MINISIRSFIERYKTTDSRVSKGDPPCSSQNRIPKKSGQAVNLSIHTALQFVRSGTPANVFYLLSIFNRHKFSSSASVAVCKSRRLYPGCSLHFRQLLTNVSSVETIMCIVSFCIGNNYRDLTTASLYVRLLQTHLLYRSPPCSLE